LNIHHIKYNKSFNREVVKKIVQIMTNDGVSIKSKKQDQDLDLSDSDDENKVDEDVSLDEITQFITKKSDQLKVLERNIKNEFTEQKKALLKQQRETVMQQIQTLSNLKNQYVDNVRLAKEDRNNRKVDPLAPRRPRRRSVLAQARAWAPNPAPGARSCAARPPPMSQASPARWPWR
jgi:NADH dehydrogenase/NADH:ubiquinone oxidoreductase subunit G